MPRKRGVRRTLNASIAENVYVEFNRAVYNEATGKADYGRRSEIVEDLISQWLENYKRILREEVMNDPSSTSYAGRRDGSASPAAPTRPDDSAREVEGDRSLPVHDPLFPR